MNWMQKVAIGCVVFATTTTDTSCETTVEEPTIDPPTIAVIIQESTDEIYVECQFGYYEDNNETIQWKSIKLTSIEEIEAYQKQVEFLLTRLEEIEEKMKSKESQ